jgi:hypothetical protein
MRTETRRLESNKERNVSFAVLILAFSLFDFFWPHQAGNGNQRHYIGFQMQKDSQIRRSAADWDHDEDGFYRPTPSPGWNDLTH